MIKIFILHRNAAPSPQLEGSTSISWKKYMSYRSPFQRATFPAANNVLSFAFASSRWQTIRVVYGSVVQGKTQESRVGLIARAVTRNNISENRFTFRASVSAWCSSAVRGMGSGTENDGATNDSPPPRRRIRNPRLRNWLVLIRLLIS